MPATQTLWQPLRNRVFRQLLAANLVSDVGSFMQSVGAAWLMVSAGAGPLSVALVQTASSLPFFLFALPAGAIGDIVDRRKLILFTEIWMTGAAVLLAILAASGKVPVWALLALTFAIAAGDAVEAPSWRATLPEFVPREDLAAASALNGIEFNLARSVGPAAAGALIAAVGVAPAFAFNAISFAGVIAVIARWRRTRAVSTVPAEHLGGATVAALRYVRFAPVVRGLVLRAGAVMLGGGALLAMLPTLAHRESGGPLGYGVLLGCFGGGAIAGALLMQSAKARWSAETVASLATLGLGASTLAAGLVHGLVPLAAVMLAAGASWIAFISLLSSAVQTLAPDWVRARAMAVYLLVFQGAMAAGSAGWGALGQRASLRTALVAAGLCTLASVVLGRLWPLPAGAVDVTPWHRWPLPAAALTAGGGRGAVGAVGAVGAAGVVGTAGAVGDNSGNTGSAGIAGSAVADLAPLDLDAGPVLVTIEYHVAAPQAAAFLTVMQDYGRLRRRDGASTWGVFRDSEASDVYLETFLVPSWAEHLRQHTRLTQADRQLETRLRPLLWGEPRVRHLTYAPPP